MISVGTTVKVIKEPPFPNFPLHVGDTAIVSGIPRCNSNYHIKIQGKEYGIPGSCVEEYKFEYGDRIRVVSDKSKYKGYLGTVFKHDFYHGNVYLFLDDTIYKPYVDWDGKDRNKCLVLKSTSIELVTNQNESEENAMNKLTGYNKVAVIKMGGVEYCYALYDENIAVGDTVLVSGVCEKVVEVTEIVTPEEANTKNTKNITAEVKCKVDLSAYNQRVENRAKAAELRKEMDQKIAEMDEMNKYVVYAERNPELAKMLEEYKKLV